MSLVGTLLFCTDCGDLLDRVASNVLKIECQRCQTLNPNKWPPSTQTSSKADAFPSSLRTKRSEIQTIDHDELETWAETSESCPLCNNTATLFTTMQLRGADEGSTVEVGQLSYGMMLSLRVSAVRKISYKTADHWRLGSIHADARPCASLRVDERAVDTEIASRVLAGDVPRGSAPPVFRWATLKLRYHLLGLLICVSLHHGGSFCQLVQCSNLLHAGMLLYE
ncbi:hypothetical protein OPT61_g10130 [Boeremia exigua]|uniref:Uncharacterized protein n=1 Tax=Boeremia exigua TaxID=749465 RepID=A0ACC2HS11_9PLEO|nr:hypothetical protein OPT61_g10130 [Boeremia exigua]